MKNLLNEEFVEQIVCWTMSWLNEKFVEWRVCWMKSLLNKEFVEERVCWRKSLLNEEFVKRKVCWTKSLFNEECVEQRLRWKKSPLNETKLSSNILNINTFIKIFKVGEYKWKELTRVTIVSESVRRNVYSETLYINRKVDLINNKENFWNNNISYIMRKGKVSRNKKILMRMELLKKVALSLSATSINVGPTNVGRYKGRTVQTSDQNKRRTGTNVGLVQTSD